MEVKKPGCREGSATRSGGRAIPPKHRRGGVKYDPPPFHCRPVKLLFEAIMESNKM